MYLKKKGGKVGLMQETTRQIWRVQPQEGCGGGGMFFLVVSKVRFFLASEWNVESSY
jgi:hypothetical protein